MPKFVIEREMPGAGSLAADQLQGAAQTSCGVLKNLGPQIQWVHSYVTDDKIYCVYIAPDEAAVRKHAEMGGFPANSVSEIRSVIDPTTDTNVADVPIFTRPVDVRISPDSTTAPKARSRTASRCSRTTPPTWAS